MKKLLIITPHLSTGGAPQVTVNKVELLKNHFDIKVVEHAFVAWNYVVQRNRIKSLLGENFHSLGEKKFEQLTEIINTFQPDVISMEEFPEMFLENELSEWIYRPDRTWRILETTHDSSFKPAWKKWTPDEFIFVSAYSAFKYAHLDMPARIIEYPVDRRKRNKVEMQEKLGLDPSYKHVVTVGLFTPRKNQAYAFEMANKLKDYKIKFHFLGNQADNFKSYWEPLMLNKPDNCVIWGERNDVSEFLQACDVFFFPSKGERNNKELNPIAIKEALEYDDLIKMMYNLDVYCGKYDDYNNMVYLTGDVGSDTTNLVTNLHLNLLQEEAIIIGTYPNLKERVRLTKECIKSLKPLGRKIILVSHYPVDQEIQRMVDFYIYDEHNPLCHHSYYTRFYNYTSQYDAEININGLKDTNQSLTVLTNLFNGFKEAKAHGFKRAFYTTFDVIVDHRDLPAIEKSFDLAEDNNAYLATLDTPFGKGIQTTAMTFDVDFFLNTFHDVRTPFDYNKICEEYGCQNFLEDYMMKVIDKMGDVHIEHPEEQTFLVNSGLGVSSNSEYYSILPAVGKPNTFVFYFYTYNVDNRVIYVTIGETFKRILVSKTKEWMHSFEFNGEPLSVQLDFYDGDDCYKIEKYEINKDNLHKYQNTGSFKWKNQKPKIKLVHIQTTLNDEREQASRASLERVKEYGWEYVLHINEPYKSLPPAHSCLRPACVSMELFDEQKIQEVGTALTPAHYGCYEAFKNAILTEFHNCDYLMVCEGDCLIETDLKAFITVVEASCQTIDDTNIGYMSFGDKDTLEFGWPQSKPIKDLGHMFTTDHIIGLQCIMFPKKVSSYLKQTLRTHPWDASDMYFNIIMRKSGTEMAIVKERLTTQADGFSLIDSTFKTFRKK